MPKLQEARVLQQHFADRYPNGDGMFQLAQQLVDHGAPYNFETTLALLALNGGIPDNGPGSKSFINALKRMRSNGRKK